MGHSGMIGKRLGHYMLTEFLGEGGMGRVYRARDEHLPRDVAIKVLHPGTLANSNARALFEREASSLSRLNHPNIATVHDFDSQDGIDYLVMELLDGETLKDRIQRGRIPMTEAARLGAQLAAGLAAAHHAGILHRDIKPGNLHVTPGWKVEDPRFRPRQGDRGRAHEDLELADRNHVSRRRRRRHVAVHVAGAIGGQRGRPANGSLRRGCNPVRNGLRRPSFRSSRAGTHPGHSQSSTARASDDRRATFRPNWNASSSSVSKRSRRAGTRPRTISVWIWSASFRPRPPRRPWACRDGDAVCGSRRRAGGLDCLLVVLLFDQWRRHHKCPVGQICLSIAVLPFENIARDTEQNYFADGMTEELITALTKIGALRVISRSSVMGYRTAPKTPSEIAKELSVAARSSWDRCCARHSVCECQRG